MRPVNGVQLEEEPQAGTDGSPPATPATPAGSDPPPVELRAPARVRRSAYIALLLGLALFTALIVKEGAGQIAAALAVAGWGLLVVAVFHFVPLSIDSIAWAMLFSRSRRPAFGKLLWARWIADAASSMLPVSQLGGEVARARALAVSGISGRLSGATVVVDVTLSALSEMTFALAGVFLLIDRLGRGAVALYVAAGVTTFAVLVGVFYRLQRRGLFGSMVRALARTTGGRMWLEMVGGAEALDEAITEIYDHPRRVLWSALFNLLSWLVGTGEVWLAMYFLGHPVDIAEAVLLESLGQAIRHAAFVIPASLGVQEGGFLFLGALVGLPPDLSLALSLAKRAREVILGVPGLISWHLAESNRLRRSKSSRAGA